MEKPAERCPKCEEKHCLRTRQDREALASLGICPRCGKNKLYGSEKECLECGAKGYAAVLKSKEKLGAEHYNNIHKQWARSAYHTRVAEGMCTRCGK